MPAKVQECPLCHLNITLKWIRRGRGSGVYVYPVHHNALDTICRNSRQTAK